MTRATIDKPEVVFDLDGIKVTDYGQFFVLRDNDRDSIDIPRRTFMQMIGGDLWDRLSNEVLSIEERTHSG